MELKTGSFLDVRINYKCIVVSDILLSC